MSKKDDGVLSSWQDLNESLATTDNEINSNTMTPYDDDIDRFFGDINDLSDRVSRMTKKIVGHTLDHQKNLPWWQSRDHTDEDEQNVDIFFNKPYQTRSSEPGFLEPLFGRLRSPFDLLNLFNESSGVTPYGLFAYQGPSSKEYNTCVKKDGVSLWDANGYWRCLFPNSQVPAQFLEYKRKQLAGQIVTKDDFEEHSSAAPLSHDGAIDLGPKGVFFRQFGDLLNWKNTNYEKEQQIAAQKREERKRNFEYNYNNSGLSNSNANGDKALVGTSVNSSTNSEAGEVVMNETKTEYYSDGTSLTKSIVKRKPQGASAWASVEEKSEEGHGKPGWFWNSK